MKYNYYAVFEKEKDGKYSIYYPDLPGCFSCGDNMEEALYMAKDALEGYLLISEEDNEFIREPSTYYELDKNLKENEILQLITADTDFIKKLNIYWKWRNYYGYNCKKGQIEKINKEIAKRNLAERRTYTVKEFPESNLSKKAEEALNKIFSSMK